MGVVMGVVIVIIVSAVPLWFLARWNEGPYVDDKAYEKELKNLVESDAEAQAITDVNELASLGWKYFLDYDYKKAAAFWAKAALQGHSGAQGRLGDLYLFGNGVSLDYKKARDWYTKSARQGDADAQTSLGVLLYNGYGGPQNKKKAKYWFSKAAKQGNEVAKRNLSSLNFSFYLEDFCYIATCVYGSYDCPEVWTLRRFRDNKLSTSWFGRHFIRIYYTVSPKIVKLFGNKKWFNGLWKPVLDKIVRALQNSGIDSNSYYDMKC